MSILETANQPKEPRPEDALALGRFALETPTTPLVDERFQQWLIYRGMELPTGDETHAAFRDSMREFLSQDAKEYIRSTAESFRLHYGYSPRVALTFGSEQVQHKIGELGPLFQTMNSTALHHSANRELARHYLATAQHTTVYPEIQGANMLASHFEAAGQEEAAAAALELQIAYGACILELRHGNFGQ